MATCMKAVGLEMKPMASASLATCRATSMRETGKTTNKKVWELRHGNKAIRNTSEISLTAVRTGTAATSGIKAVTTKAASRMAI